jgi:hypothetical protein
MPTVTCRMEGNGYVHKTVLFRLWRSTLIIRSAFALSHEWLPFCKSSLVIFFLGLLYLYHLGDYGFRKGYRHRMYLHQFLLTGSRGVESGRKEHRLLRWAASCQLMRTIYQSELP